MLKYLVPKNLTKFFLVKMLIQRWFVFSKSSKIVVFFDDEKNILGKLALKLNVALELNIKLKVNIKHAKLVMGRVAKCRVRVGFGF